IAPGDSDQIWKEPGESSEAFVERRAEHFLAAVLRDEPLNNLVVRFVLIDQRGELAAQLIRRAARSLAAFGVVRVTAGAARADDFVLQLALERRARIVRR